MRLTEQTEQEPSPRGAITLLHQGCWQHLPIGTIERLAVGGRPTECAAGYTVYSEADAEALAVITRGLVRVYMHASDGRQVTVRYVRPGGLLGGSSSGRGPGSRLRPGRYRRFRLLLLRRA